MYDYAEKIKRERRAYEGAHDFHRTFLDRILLFSSESNYFNYIFPKTRFFDLAKNLIVCSTSARPSVLIAPVGVGDDLKYIDNSVDLAGLDLSPEAIDKIANVNVRKFVGDIKRMDMFGSNSFDIIVTPLFFHHYVRYGFAEFLGEFYRVLRPGGHFLCLEPSLLHPVTIITKSFKGVVYRNNFHETYEEESAFFPWQLLRAMKSCGFKDVYLKGASFTHNRTPVRIAKLNNILTGPLLNCPILKYFAWLCIFYGKK